MLLADEVTVPSRAPTGERHDGERDEHFEQREAA